MSDMTIYSKAAARYRPKPVKLLWIAHAPPSSPDRYFYFETMSHRDLLFREVMKAVFPGCSIPWTGQSKRPLLCKFRDAGAYLIDLCKDPDHPSPDRWWPTTKGQITRLNPERIVPVMVGWYVRPRLVQMGLGDRLLTIEDVPFPVPQWQRKFHDILDPLLRELYRGREG